MRAFPYPLASGLAVLFLASAALAEVRKVPSEAYPTIQSAVDASGDGDVILLTGSPGGYHEDIVIEGKSNLTIRGTGRYNAVGGGIGSEGPTVLVSGGSDISFRGVAFSGGSFLADAVVAEGVEGLRFEDVYFSGERIGLSTSACTDVLVSRCRFASLDGDMILDDGSSGYVVERCFFLRPQTYAVNLSPGAAPGEGTDGAVLVKNVVYGASFLAPASGFQVTGDGAVIERNVLTRLWGDYGIVATGSGTVVDRNRVEAQNTAIAVAGGAALVTRNRVGTRFNTDSDIGILVLSSGVTVSKNRVTGSDDFDLADAQAEGINTYEKNRFGTTQFSFVP